MRRILAGKSIWTRITFPNRFKLVPIRPFCSATQKSKPTTTNSGDGSNNGSSSSSPPSLSNYSEQYKALQNLDFMKAAKILFSETGNKKKFGLDFHLVQLFFVCLPSLAVYLVAQYARSEMRKMDAERSFLKLPDIVQNNWMLYHSTTLAFLHSPQELERKKQAEFEAQAKEMELKAAEEKSKVASNPALLEMKERLDKLELTIEEIAVESKKQLNDATKEGREGSNEQKKAAEVEPDNTPNQSGGKTLTKGMVSSEGKSSGLAPFPHI